MRHAVIQTGFDVPFVGMQTEGRKQTDDTDDEQCTCNHRRADEGKPVKVPGAVRQEQRFQIRSDTIAEK